MEILQSKQREVEKEQSIHRVQIRADNSSETWEALKRRKEVLDEKLYRNAYVKFPAILMGRKDGEDTYSVVADFSEAPVSKLPVLVSNDI